MKFNVLFAAAILVFAISPAAAQPGEDSGTKSVNDELLELEQRSEVNLPKDLAEAAEKGNKELKESGILENALNVGDAAPDFVLSDAFNKEISSKDLRADGNIVLVFYRGAWCPYCNIYLRGLQRQLPELKKNNTKLVAISVEPPDRSLSVVKENKLDFTVLSDQKLTVARKYGIVYELPKVVNEAVLKRGFDIAKYNNAEKPELPLSATYVIDRSGKIRFAFLEIDYKKRAAPSEIISVLEKIEAEKE